MGVENREGTPEVRQSMLFGDPLAEIDVDAG